MFHALTLLYMVLVINLISDYSLLLYKRQLIFIYRYFSFTHLLGFVFNSLICFNEFYIFHQNVNQTICKKLENHQIKIFLFNLDAFYSFYYIIILTRISRTMTDRSGGNR